MIGKITQSPTLNIMGGAIQAANLRHSVISNNIANVNTPGFKKSEVAFENLLAEALSPSLNKLKMIRTQEKHLPITKRNPISPEVYEINTTTMRTDGNNVDIDAEMAAMAKNTIYYDANVRQISGYFSSIKSVINGQK